MWRLTNLVLFIVWAIMIPVSYVTGWVESIIFVSLASIYANMATHLAGWRADEPTPERRKRGSRD